MEYKQQFEDRYQTPIWACNLMADLVPDGVKTILEPTPGEGRLVRVLRERGYEVTAPFLFEDISPFNRFDAIVMNPPFLKSIQHKFLLAAMRMSDNVIALLPWFSLINSDSRTIELKNFGIRSVHHLPRMTFRQIRVQTMILCLQKGYSGNIDLQLIDRNFAKNQIKLFNETTIP